MNSKLTNEEWDEAIEKRTSETCKLCCDNKTGHCKMGDSCKYVHIKCKYINKDTGKCRNKNCTLGHRRHVYIPHRK